MRFCRLAVYLNLVALFSASGIARPNDVRTEDRHFDRAAEFSTSRLTAIKKTHKRHRPVLFEDTQLNTGGYYNFTAGFFKAPTAGLYIFNISTYASMRERLRLMKNDYEVRVVRKDGKKEFKASTDLDIMLQLEKADKIWIRVAHCKRHKGHRQPGASLTTSYGRLLTEEVHLDTNDSSLTRRKRATEASLQRIIRETEPPAVTLVQTRPLKQRTSSHNASRITQKIAFSVTCTKSIIGGQMADTTMSIDGPVSPESAPNGRVSFDKVLVNVGDGFSIEAREFRAPTNGVYFFSYNVGKFPKKKLSVMLMENFNEVQSIIYNDSQTRAREMQGQSVMLDLKEGDAIWLRSYNDDDYAVYSNLGNYITFNGYLVFGL
nr:C1qDC [Botryllus schlosseri]